MKKLMILLPLILYITSCKSVKTNTDTQMELLYNMMQGSYDSSLQASVDSTYYNISLEMHPVWQDSNEKWLYVEQALAGRKDKPYRVRMYRLKRIDENTIASEVYTIPDEQQYYGKYNNPSAFKNLKPSDLKERDGCAVLLKKTNDGFSGSTGEKTCKSTLRGASYATSLVLIKEHQIISWDRGFNDKDEQVWGAEKGGYIFINRKLKKLKF